MWEDGDVLYSIAFRSLGGSHRWGTRVDADDKSEAVADACRQMVRAWAGEPPDFAVIEITDLASLGHPE